MLNVFTRFPPTHARFQSHARHRRRSIHSTRSSGSVTRSLGGEETGEQTIKVFKVGRRPPKTPDCRVPPATNTLLVDTGLCSIDLIFGYELTVLEELLDKLHLAEASDSCSGVAWRCVADQSYLLPYFPGCPGRGTRTTIQDWPRRSARQSIEVLAVWLAVWLDDLLTTLIKVTLRAEPRNFCIAAKAAIRYASS